MFEPAPGPRVFALPPGADFARGFVEGLLDRAAGMAPEELARVEIYANAGRMQRQVRDALEARAPLLLPRLRLVADVAQDVAVPGLPPPVPALRLRLELAQLVRALLDAEPSLAPRASVYDLADGLARLFAEMQDEGVAFEALRDLDVAGQSAHWERSLKFIGIVARYAAGTSGPPDAAGAGGAPDAASRQRLAVETLAGRWAEAPPRHPVLVMGSTGSRGATLELMEAVARLPQGALVLPGFDAELPGAVWQRLDDPMTGEDHPQFRYAKLMRRLGIGPAKVRPWAATTPAPSRNRLVSLALRPAPVTDQWMTEGPRLPDIAEATAAMTLIEAPTPRMEATAIALRLRQAAEDGQTAALVTPDRNLTRRVTAILDRWGIEPDDSGGLPLGLSPPGRLLRHVADAFARPITPDLLLSLLKHPLVRPGCDRGAHQLHARELELWLRRRGPAFPDAAALRDWAGEDPARRAWADRLAPLLALPQTGTAPLAEFVAGHRAVAEALCLDAAGASELWQQDAGTKARAAMDELAREAGHGGEMAPLDYVSLITGVLEQGEVRSAVRPHPGVMIWGTLEARVGGADLVILAGLNEGVWPAPVPADPWLNRQMRHEAGLRLPERQIGLAAHDFQQAIGAREVVLSRAVRDAEAETVASRWLNRLTNLLSGLAGTGGAEALDAMRRRGRGWLRRARHLDDAPPVAPAPRPSPRPPVAARPRTLSVTRIADLIRDPYAIYARNVLGLRRLDPLVRAPDAPLRGMVLHDIFHRFVEEGGGDAARLSAIAAEELAAQVPWPAARRLWQARLDAMAGWFVADEAERRAEGTPVLTETPGELTLEAPRFTLTGRPDRIDRLQGGGYAIYDYKSGTPPSVRQVRSFDKQLVLEAMMAEAGAFADLPPEPVRRLAYIGVGTRPNLRLLPLDEGDDPIRVAEAAEQFRALVASVLAPEHGFTARRAPERIGFAGDYDDLARYGEWSDSTDAAPEDVG